MCESNEDCEYNFSESFSEDEEGNQYISFEEQMKEIRKNLETAKEMCEKSIICSKAKSLWLCGCCGDKILMCVEEAKQKLHEVRKMLDLN